MANKRQTKKNRKKRLKQQVTTVRSDIKVNKLTEKELEVIISQEEQKAQKEQQKKDRRIRLLENRAKKSNYLESKGFDPWKLTVKQLDKIKLKDIDSNNLNRETYPFLFGLDKFDFDRVYKLKDGERLYLAFRDFAGETSLEEIIAEYSGMSNEKLLSKLEEIVHTRPTFNRKEYHESKGSAGTSSGHGGDYKMEWAVQNVITEAQAETYNANRRKATKNHPGQYKGFQVLKDGFRNSFDEVTPRGLLIIMNAFTHYITENDRLTFYNDIYLRIQYHMPDFAEILPKPL